MGSTDARGPAPRASVIALTALAAWLGAAAASAADAPPDAKRRAEPPPVEDRETGPMRFLSAPPFPDLDITEAVRIRLDTFVAPKGSMASGDVSVVSPELDVRATWLAGERFVSRISMELAETQYDFQGDAWEQSIALPSGEILEADPLIGDLDLHSAQFTLDGAYVLSDRTNWFADGERWSALGSLYGGSRWEDGNFDDGANGGGALGIGYEVGKKLRVALGVTLRSPLDKGNLDVDPLFSLRWRPSDRVTLRTRELGLQVEIGLTPAFGIHLAGFRSSDGYRLRDREPLGDLFFRDRQIRVGGGFEWVLANWLHLEMEAGGLLERQLRVREEDLGTVFSRRVGPSPYAEIWFEIRL